MRLGLHRALALALVMGAVGLSVAQGAGDPWNFSTASEQRDAEKRWSQYWTENYPRAEEILDGSSPDASDLKEAIERLKLAVANDRTSAAKKLNPKMRINVSYFPYYQLARAYVAQGRPDLAKRCLEREASFGEIGSSKLAGDFTGLQARVEASATVPELLSLAARVEGWADKSRVSKVRTLKTQLEQASKSTDVDRLTRASGELVDELIAFAEAEVAPRRARLQTLAGAGWRGAFRTAPDADVCAVPSEGSGVERAGRALSAVEACSERSLGAMRTAGSWACEELQSERKVLEGLAAERTQLLGSPPAMPELPSGCALAWATASPAELATALDGLDVAALRAKIAESVQTVRAELGRKRDEMQSAAVAVLARKPSIPRGCVNELNLSQIARRLDALPSDPAKVNDPAELGGKIDALVADLAGALKAGVTRLDQDRDDCEGLDTTNLDALQAAMTGYESKRDPQRLNELCSAATRASADINRCWSENSALVAENVGNARWLLDAAIDMRRIAPPSEGADLTCLSTIRGQLRPAAPRRDKLGWSQAQRELVNEAQACLSAHVEEWRTQFDTSLQRVAAVRSKLEPLEASASGGTLGQLGSMAGTAAQLQSTIAGFDALYDSAPSTVDALRQSLEARGVVDRVPGDWWKRAESVPQKELARTLEAIRDLAAGSAVGDALERLAPLERVSGSISPLVALQGAFSAFDEGNVDAAILRLRRAQAVGDFPDGGRPAALGHAALSYFLFTKATAAALASDGGDAARLLQDDAEREARASLTADNAFEPPASLFASDSFRSFFSQQSR